MQKWFSPPHLGTHRARDYKVLQYEPLANERELCNTLCHLYVGLHIPALTARQFYLLLTQLSESFSMLWNLTNTITGFGVPDALSIQALTSCLNLLARWHTSYSEGHFRLCCTAVLTLDALRCS
jgi:hypothetical protein